MERNSFFCNLGLYIKSVLVLILLLGGSGSAWAESNTTVNDGTSNTSNYFPFYGTYANKSAASSQVIIPSGSLTAIKGCTISKIVFYTNNASTSWGTATFKVYLKETDDTAFGSDALADFGTMTEVYSGSVSTNASKEMEITFGKGFAYSGNNLLVGFDLTNPASSGIGITCYGIAPTPSTTKSMVYKYLNYSNTPVIYRESFLPKMTIYYSGTAAPTSLTVNSSTYDSATLGWTKGGDETQWQIVCSTTDNSGAETPTLTDSNPYTIEGLSENTTYYAFVRAYYSADTQSDWARISFTTPRQYPIPTDFSLTGFTATTASFTWTNGVGTTPTAWQIKYSTNEDFNPDESGTAEAVYSKPHTLEGLTEGTTYYAYIRARYGESNYSGWTEKVEFTPTNEIVRTLFDGTATAYNLPISSSNVANNIDLTQTQFIIPKDSLSFMKNQQITTLKFYASRASVTWGSATWEVYLKETDNMTYNTSTKTFDSWGTCVYNNAGLSTDSKGEMTIELNTPFNYTGKNLMVGFKQKTKGTTPSSTYWYSINTSAATNRGIYHYGTYNGVISYLPKMTITSVPIKTAPIQMDNYGFTTFASPYPLDLTTSNMPAGLTAYRAAEIDAGKSIVRFTSDINQTVQANTGILLKGTANTTYSIPVVASGSALEDNALLVNEEGGTFTGDGDYTYFAMKKNSNPLTFGTFDPSTTAIPSNKAYLKVLTSSLPSGARTLRFVFDDNETTGIKNVDAQKTSSKDVYFNLNGQRVAKPTKGMYISNGKKYIVK